MRILSTVAAALALGIGLASYAPGAKAGVLVGVGLPGVAIVAPGPAIVAPTPYYPYPYPYYYGPGVVIGGGPYVHGYLGPRYFHRGYGYGLGYGYRGHEFARGFAHGGGHR